MKTKELKIIGMLFLLVILISIFSNYVSAVTAGEVCTSEQGFSVGVSEGQEPGAEGPIDMKKFEIWACKSNSTSGTSKACKGDWQFADFEQIQNWVPSKPSIPGCYVYSGGGDCSSKCEIGDKGIISIPSGCAWNNAWDGVLCFKLPVSTPEEEVTLPETCDGKDNDNDGKVDEDFDVDKDTFTGKIVNEKHECGTRTLLGLDTNPTSGCSWIENQLNYDPSCDCDDNNSKINPEAKELCNGVDDNCNGLIDNADLSMEPCPIGQMCKNGKCVEDVCDGEGNTPDGTDRIYCDKDGDGYCPIGKTCTARNYNCENGKCTDCEDTEVLEICKKIVCCQVVGVEDKYMWGIKTGEKGQECNNNPKLRALTDERMCLLKASESKEKYACSSPVYASCSFCINPGMSKKCGVDADCSGKVWNGYTNTQGNQMPCEADEQCVMYGEKTFDESGGNVPGESLKYKKCSFLPGAVKGDAECGLKQFESLMGRESSDERINCLPDNERITIDKKTGELDWFKFVRENDEKGGTNPCGIFALDPKLDFWKTACVERDKCMDKVDNNKPKNLYEVDYLFYKDNFDFEIEHFCCEWENGKKEFLYSVKECRNKGGKPVEDKECYGQKPPNIKITPTPYMVRLKDADDPDCHKEPYCIDKDGDGFCENSNLFPDCDDNPDDDEEQYTYYLSKAHPKEPVKIFNPNYDKADPSSKPMIPVTSNIVHPALTIFNTREVFPHTLLAVCGYGTDINCNKGYKDETKGYDWSQLHLGITPYDSNPNTGIEKIEKGSDPNTDYFCHSTTAFETLPRELIREMPRTLAIAGVSAVTAVVIGGTFGIGTIFLPATTVVIGKILLVAGTAYMAAEVGYDVYKIAGATPGVAVMHWERAGGFLAGLGGAISGGLFAGKVIRLAVTKPSPIEKAILAKSRGCQGYPKTPPSPVPNYPHKDAPSSIRNYRTYRTMLNFFKGYFVRRDELVQKLIVLRRAQNNNALSPELMDEVFAALSERGINVKFIDYSVFEAVLKSGFPYTASHGADSAVVGNTLFIRKGLSPQELVHEVIGRAVYFVLRVGYGTNANIPYTCEQYLLPGVKSPQHLHATEVFEDLVAWAARDPLYFGY